MNAKKTDAQKIAAIAARHEADGWSYYARYSGRYMYGRECPGIVCPPSDIGRARAAARRHGISGCATDSMGLDSIIYWPGVEAEAYTPEPEAVETK